MYIEKYDISKKNIWDEFVKLAKNYHFFFERDYLDYHAERFIDNSLMIYNNKNTLIALLPANIFENKLYSHQGLTFGGLILKPSIKQKDVLEILFLIKHYLKEKKLDGLIYKKIPYIYNTIPCDEDLYGLFRINANLIRRDVSSAIKMSEQIKYSKGRKWIIKKAKESGLNYSIAYDIKEFWSNLNDVLKSSHGVSSVHTIDEILKLKSSFEKNINFYSASLNGKILAGAVVFETRNIAHTQYLFNTFEGREIGALDGLIDYLVKNLYLDKEYFDFGISNEDDGYYLNEGLISQKEGFGARAIVHDFYEVTVND